MNSFADLEREEKGSCTILRFHGSWDLTRHGELRTLFQELASRNEPRILINLSQLTRISSSTLGSIVALMKDAQNNGGQVVIAEPSETTRMTIELLRLEQMLKMYKTEQQAMEALQG